MSAPVNGLLSPDQSPAFNCPVCGESPLQFKDSEYVAPYFGRMLLSLTFCSRCGFKQRQVTLLEEHEPSVYSVGVSSIDDLSIRIIRSDTASIRIPELGVEINPGLVADATISNVESILLDVRDRARFLRDSVETEEERHNAENFLEELGLALEGKKHFTFVVEDPRGNSKIVADDPSKVIVRPLQVGT